MCSARDGVEDIPPVGLPSTDPSPLDRCVFQEPQHSLEAFSFSPHFFHLRLADLFHSPHASASSISVLRSGTFFNCRLSVSLRLSFHVPLHVAPCRSLALSRFMSLCLSLLLLYLRLIFLLQTEASQCLYRILLRPQGRKCQKASCLR